MPTNTSTSSSTGKMNRDYEGSVKTPGYSYNSDSNLGTSSGSSTGSSFDTAKEFLGDAREGAESVIRNVREKAPEMIRKAGSSVNGYIRENPVQAALVAAGVGFVLGSMIKKSIRKAL